MNTLKQYCESMNNDKLFEKLDEMIEILGAETMLNELAQAIPSHKLEEYLRFIDKNNETNVF